MKRTPLVATITGASILFLVLPWFGPVAGVSEYVIRFLGIIFLWIGKTGSWNIVAGYTGYIDFGAVAYFGIGAAITGMAGSLISTYFIIFPQMGLPYTILAFCIVVLGGMGYVPGALWGGLILGVIQSVTATYLNAGLSGALTFILLFVMLIVRPAGIAGKGIIE